MRLLDLFCGAGGAAMGYHRAGFDEIVGVDIKAQPRYPFTFVQGDALKYVLEHGRAFDAIHASPPCQAYIRSGMVAKDGRHQDLLGKTRITLSDVGQPFVIENVPGSPIRASVMLCGSMFGLAIRRHRYFEGPFSPMTLSCRHDQAITGVYGHPHGKGGAWRNGRRPMLPSDAQTWRKEMGIWWMKPLELAAAIPPAYTEFIGRQLLEARAGTSQNRQNTQPGPAAGAPAPAARPIFSADCAPQSRDAKPVSDTKSLGRETQ